MPGTVWPLVMKFVIMTCIHPLKPTSVKIWILDIQDGGRPLFGEHLNRHILATVWASWNLASWCTGLFIYVQRRGCSIVASNRPVACCSGFGCLFLLPTTTEVAGFGFFPLFVCLFSARYLKNRWSKDHHTWHKMFHGEHRNVPRLLSCDYYEIIYFTTKLW